MGDVCISFSWTYRPILPMLLILATFTFMVQGSRSPVASVSLSKSYPRGNHWAVGHLMGRKSVEMFPEPPVDEPDRGDYQLTSLERSDATLDQQFPSKLDRALFGSSPSSQRQTPYSAHRRFLEKTRWREEVRFKPVREMPDLLLLGLNLKNGGSR